MTEQEELHKISLLVARLDERTKSMVETMERLEKDFNDREKNFVTKSEFLPVKIVVYGFVSLALTAVVGALISVVLK